MKLKNATEPLQTQNFNNQEILKTLFLINKTFNEFGNEVHGDVEHPKENNLKVEEVNHEQNLDSVYESSEFKHDIQAWQEGSEKGGTGLKKCVCVLRHFQI